MPQSEGGGATREHHNPPLPVPSAPAEQPRPQTQVQPLAQPSHQHLFKQQRPQQQSQQPSQPQSNASVQPAATENGRGRTLTYEDLSRCFHLPINAAAKELGVCVTALKKQCRKHGVPRWPHRKLKSLDKLKEKLEKEEATAADKEYYKHEIHSITQKKDHIFRSSSTNAANASASVAGNPATSIPASGPGLHPRPGHHHHHHHHPLLVGRPIPHFPGLPQKPGAPFLTAAAAHFDTARMKQANATTSDGEQHHHQQQQHIIAGPIIMPIAQMPGATTATAIATGPNGTATLIPQPIAGAQPYSLCGFFGCDCYLHNGVSTRMYHPPLANGVPRPPPTTAAPNHVNASAAPPNIHHYFNSAPYAYAPTMTGMAPYQNMVQVNVVEQPPSVPYGSRAPDRSTTPAVSAPMTGSKPSIVRNSGSQPRQSGATRTATSNPASTKPSAILSAPGFEMYGNVAGQHNGFVYNSFVPHYEGMIPHQTGAGPVPTYWTELPHQQTPGNMVTMCNQTVHHHHHHATETASPSLGQSAGRKPIPDGVDNASTKTGNSEGVPETKCDINDKASSKPDAGGPPKSERVQSSRSPSCKGTGNTCGSDGNREQSQSQSDPFRNKSSSRVAQGKDRQGGSAVVDDDVHKTYSAHTMSDSKDNMPGAPLPNGKKSSVSDTTSCSSRSNEKKSNQGTRSRRPNKKRTRSQRSPERDSSPPGDDDKMSSQGDKGDPGSEQRNGSRGSITDGGRNKPRWGASSSKTVTTDLPNGKPSPARKEGQQQQATSHQTITASTVNRARRYDHVVHQCLGLQSAQWCTDLTFKVTLALGPKTMLGLAGVPSLGKSVLDGTETALEDRSATKNRYVMAGKGQRLEWIAANGESRYLIVMNPFRRRNCAEICGVSGLMVELKIIRALAGK